MELDKILLLIISIFGVEDYSDNLFLLLDEKKIILLISFSLIFFILLTYLLLVLIKNFKIVKIYISKFISAETLFFDKILYSKFYLLLIFPLALNLYLIITLPITYDEAWTYNNFISKGLLVSVSYYPMPNNHVLYNAISSIINLFFNSNSIYIFRLISCFFYILSIYVFLKILLLRGKKFLKLNYLILSLAPLTLITIYQSSLARGYSLLLFLFLICIFILLSIAKKDKFYKWVCWAFFTSLCFFSNPAYFYTHLVICLIIFLFIQNSFKNLVIGNALSFIFTLFLYFPIIIFQGFDFLLKIKTTDELSYLNYFKHIFEILERDMLGLSIYFISFLFLISIIYLYFSKQKNLFVISIILILIPLLIPFFQNSIAPARIFIIFYFFYMCLILLPLENYLSKFNKNKIILISLLLQVIFGGHVLSKMPHEKYSENAEDLSLKILSNNKNYFFCSDKNDPLIPTLLKYYQTKFKIKNILINKLNKKNCNFLDYNNYDWVLIDKKIDITENQIHLKLVTDEFNVYSVNYNLIKIK